MTKFGGIVLSAAVFGVCGVFGAGCSSTPADPYGATPDFGALEAQFQHPTGTFKGNEGPVFAGYSNAQNGSSSAGALGGAFGGSSSAQSIQLNHLHSMNLHTLAGTATGPACNFSGGSTTGSCSCASGGTIQYDISGFQSAEQSANKATVKGTLKFAAQGCNDGTDTLDGHMFIYIDGSYVGATSASSTDQGAAASESFSEVFDAHFTDVNAAGTTKVDLDYILDASSGSGSYQFLVTLADGSTVVVSGTWSSTSGGQVTIRDSHGTVTCTSSDGKTATCTDAAGTTSTVNIGG